MGYNLQAADDLMLGKGPLELRQVSPEHMALVIGQVVGVWGRHFDEVEAVCFLKSKSRRQPNFHVYILPVASAAWARYGVAKTT
jgi:hypothetical protein